MERTIRGEFIHTYPEKGSVHVTVDWERGSRNNIIRLDPYEARQLGMRLIVDADFADRAAGYADATPDPHYSPKREANATGNVGVGRTDQGFPRD